MSDYIEREAAQSAVWEEDNQTDMILAIGSLPAADVEPVVHCGDCKYLEFSDFYGECGRSYLGVVRPWDYCSRGARRNKEDNT